MNLQAFAIFIDGSSDGSGCRLLFARTSLSSLKFTHFLKRFLQFNYFGGILVGEIHQRFTEYSPEVFVVLAKRKKKNIFHYFDGVSGAAQTFLRLSRNVSLHGCPVSSLRTMPPSCSCLWRPTSTQQFGRCLLYCVELWIYNSRTKTVCRRTARVGKETRMLWKMLRNIVHTTTFDNVLAWAFFKRFDRTSDLVPRTLSATFLCNINGNTCSDNFLSGTRLFSQP